MKTVECREKLREGNLGIRNWPVHILGRNVGSRGSTSGDTLIGEVRVVLEIPYAGWIFFRGKCERLLGYLVEMESLESLRRVQNGESERAMGRSGREFAPY